LPQFQELYIEWLVRAADYHIIFCDSKIAGYFIVNADKTLLEFYAEPEYISECDSIFQEISISYFDKVYCKSFDPVLLKCCLSRGCNYKIVGTLFRDRTHKEHIDYSGSAPIIASEEDIDLLVSHKDGLYESVAELHYMLTSGMIHMFFDGDVLVGCGYLIRIHENFVYHDIGMWVSTPYRNRGIATKIISYLKKLCDDNKYIPICGCSRDNIPSRKALERNGFISRYDLIEFSM